MLANKITYEKVHELFEYDEVTGIFTNKTTRGGVLKGEVAGCFHEGGYWRIRVNKKQYFAHRLAWLYYYGYFPENQIDHKDRIRHHNWIDNLREITQSCNLRNSKIQSNNTSGITGVTWFKRGRKWQVTIQDKNHKLTYIGSFVSKLEAAKARYEAEVEHNYTDCNTQSTALAYINNNKGSK